MLSTAVAFLVADVAAHSTGGRSGGMADASGGSSGDKGAANLNGSDRAGKANGSSNGSGGNGTGRGGKGSTRAGKGRSLPVLREMLELDAAPRAFTQTKGLLSIECYEIKASMSGEHNVQLACCWLRLSMVCISQPGQLCC